MVKFQSVKILIAVVAAALGSAIFAATAAAAVTVTTEEPTAITSGGATFHGTLEVEKHETAYGFQYATKQYYEETGTFDHNTPRVVIPPGETKPIQASYRVVGLESGKEYVVRLIALVYHYGLVPGKLFTFQTGHKPYFVSSNYSAMSGEQIGSFTLLTANEIGLLCHSSQWNATASAGSYQLPFEVSFSGCEDEFENEATVEMNSCGYVLTIANAGPPYSGKLGVSCEKEGDAIKIKDPGFGATFAIGAQSSVGTVGYENAGEESPPIYATLEAEGLTYECTGLSCFLIGGGGVHEDGAMSGEVELIGGFVDGEEVPDLSVAGEESAEEANQPHFSSAEYPATISGEQVGTLTVLTANEIGVICHSSQWSATASAGSSQLPLGVSFSSCEDEFENEATVEMNSCSYVLTVANAGPPYSGGVGVSCGEKGDAIKIKDPGFGATFTIGAQPSVGTVGYENVNEGEGQSVDATLEAEGLTFECTGVSCFLIGGGGVHENGAMSGEVELG